MPKFKETILQACAAGDLEKLKSIFNGDYLSEIAQDEADYPASYAFWWQARKSRVKLAQDIFRAEFRQILASVAKSNNSIEMCELLFVYASNNWGTNSNDWRLLHTLAVFAAVVARNIQMLSFPPLAPVLQAELCRFAQLKLMLDSEEGFPYVIDNAIEIEFCCLCVRTKILHENFFLKALANIKNDDATRYKRVVRAVQEECVITQDSNADEIALSMLRNWLADRPNTYNADDFPETLLQFKKFACLEILKQKLIAAIKANDMKLINSILLECRSFLPATGIFNQPASGWMHDFVETLIASVILYDNPEAEQLLMQEPYIKIEEPAIISARRGAARAATKLITLAMHQNDPAAIKIQFARYICLLKAAQLDVDEYLPSIIDSLLKVAIKNNSAEAVAELLKSDAIRKCKTFNYEMMITGLLFAANMQANSINVIRVFEVILLNFIPSCGYVVEQSPTIVDHSTPVAHLWPLFRLWLSYCKTPRQQINLARYGYSLAIEQSDFMLWQELSRMSAVREQFVVPEWPNFTRNNHKSLVLYHLLINSNLAEKIIGGVRTTGFLLECSNVYAALKAATSDEEFLSSCSLRRGGFGILLYLFKVAESEEDKARYISAIRYIVENCIYRTDINEVLANLCFDPVMLQAFPLTYGRLLNHVNTALYAQYPDDRVGYDVFAKLILNLCDTITSSDTTEESRHVAHLALESSLYKLAIAHFMPELHRRVMEILAVYLNKEQGLLIHKAIAGVEDTGELHRYISDLLQLNTDMRNHSLVYPGVLNVVTLKPQTELQAYIKDIKDPLALTGMAKALCSAIHHQSSQEATEEDVDSKELLALRTILNMRLQGKTIFALCPELAETLMQALMQGIETLPGRPSWFSSATAQIEGEIFKLPLIAQLAFVESLRNLYEQKPKAETLRIIADVVMNMSIYSLNNAVTTYFWSTFDPGYELKQLYSELSDWLETEKGDMMLGTSPSAAKQQRSYSF